MITSTGDPRPFISTDLAIASAQVIQAADVTVSVQLGPLYQWYQRNHSIILIDQTYQLGVSASVSTSAINDIASVAHVEEHPNTFPSSYDTIFQCMESQHVSCFPTCFLASADDRQNQYPELGGSLNAGEGQIPLSQWQSPFFIQDFELGGFSSADEGQIPVSQQPFVSTDLVIVSA